MWVPWRWWTAGDARAVENARAAAVECGRRRVERAEVELYVAARAQRRRPQAQHPA